MCGGKHTLFQGVVLSTPIQYCDISDLAMEVWPISSNNSVPSLPACCVL